MKSAAPPATPTPRWAWALLAVLLCLPVGLAVDSLRSKTLTWDEPIYLGAGHYLVYTRDFSIAALTYHPPLAFYLSSLGLMGMELPREAFPAGRFGSDWDMGMSVLAYAGDAADAVRTRARIPFVLLFVPLGAAVFAWSCSLWGWRGGLLSLWLVAWSPTLLAHARIVATDFLFTTLLVSTLWSARALLQRGSWWRYGRTGVVAGLAALSKFSSVVLGPVALVGALLAWRAPAAGRWRNWSAGRIALALLGLVVCAGVVVWAGYLGQIDVAVPDPARRREFQAATPPGAFVPRVLFELYRSELKLPAMSYVTGFISQYLHGTIGHPSYLFGRISWEGWWYYFPVVVLVKTPLPVLGLWALGIGAWARARCFGREAVWLATAPVMIGVLAMRANINIGVRHVLPLYPLAAIAVGAAWRPGTSRSTRAAAVAGALWLAGETLCCHPHYLAYFNQLAGGSDQGHRILVDSNLDWGQDLDALVSRAQAEGWLPLQVQYFGALPLLRRLPAGITPIADPCAPARGYVAVSVTNRMGVHVPGGPDCMAWLDAYEPIARVNHTIWVYAIPEDT